MPPDGAGNGRNADGREETGQAPERDGDGGRAGPDTRAHGRGRHFQRRGLYAEDGPERLYPPCGPFARPGAGLLAAAVLQQPEPDSRPRPHLRAVPGRD